MILKNAQYHEFHLINNPRPWKNNEIICHGLVRCTTCHRTLNRDYNASRNILNIALNHLNGIPRPEYLINDKTVNMLSY